MGTEKFMTKEKLKQGFIHVYTGNGKGKTTAALGIALRAAGRGLRVFILQFMKGGDYGEVKAVKLLKPYITMKQTGLCTFVDKDNPSREDIRLAKEGLKIASKAIKDWKYDMVILDEIICAVDFKLIDLKKVLDMLGKKPPFVELILTGRNAPKEIIDIADLVTEMKEIKHYYRSLKVGARKGIEL